MCLHLNLRFVYTILFILALLSAACSPKHYIQIHDESIALYYENTGAKEILFASSIDRFRLHPAIKVKGDIWKVIVPKEKEFSYFYLVDKTLTLPDCQFTVLDDFGAKNCLFVSEL